MLSLSGYPELIDNPEVGRRGWTRTSDHLLRRQVLYPPELRAQTFVRKRLVAFSAAALTPYAPTMPDSIP
jgi:hypothetical protein